MSHITKKLDEERGYCVERILNDAEFSSLYLLVEKKWKEKLMSSKLINAAEKCESIKDYHHYIDDINHQELWSKTTRLFTEKEVKSILSMDMYKKLKVMLGSITISDEENIGYPNIYWRLVRPWKEKDIGPVHRDEWFWILNQSYKMPINKRRIKIWIPLAIEANKSGLLVEDNSHKRNDIEWDGEQRHGIIKPILITNHDKLDLKLAEAKLGDGIIFHDRLIHGGKLNTGDKTRVSVEFTALIDE